MKKRFSILTVAIVGFFMMAVGVGATAGYIEWKGSPDFRQTLINLNLINERGEELKKNIKQKEDKITELEDFITTGENELAKIKTDVAGIITNVNGTNGKGQKFDTLQGDINALAEYLEIEGRVNSTNNDEDYTGKSDQLKQAEEDMRDVKNKSEEILESLNTPVETTGDGQ